MSAKDTTKSKNVTTIEVFDTVPNLNKFNLTDLISMRNLLTYETNSIKNSLENILDNFFDIGRSLSYIKKDEAYLVSGHLDIYAYAEEILGFSRTLTKNYISVYERFGNEEPETFIENGFSFSQLVEMLPMENVDILNAEMTIREIREVKVIEKIAKKFDDEKKIILEYFNTSLRDKIHDLLLDYDFTHFIEIKVNPLIVFEVTFKNSNHYFNITYYDNKNEFRINSSLYYFWANDINIIEDLENRLDDETFKRFLEYVNKETEQKVNETKKTKDKTVVNGNVVRVEDTISVLKNNEQREEFLKNLDNWTLYNEVSFLGHKFYEFKFNVLINKNWWMIISDTGVRDYTFKRKDQPIHLFGSSPLSYLVDDLKAHRQNIISGN